MAVGEFFVCGEAGPGGRGAGVNQPMLISPTSQGRAAGPSQGLGHCHRGWGPTCQDRSAPNVSYN